MRTTGARIALIALCAFFIACPPGLLAGERRGAELIVTRLDGRQHGGELIAVKPDSLLLLSGAGTDLSIDITEIRSVRIVRKSKAGRYGLIGGLAGFVGMGGVVLAIAEEDVVGNKAGAAALYGLIAGAAGALAGTIVGSALGIDSVITIAGEPEAVVADYLNKLGSYSREGRLSGVRRPPGMEPRQAQQAGAVRPNAPPAAPPGLPRGPRFRISLAGWFERWSHASAAAGLSGEGSFYFPEETSPESGPYPLGLTGQIYPGREEFALGPVSLAYELNDNWSAEIEYSTLGHGSFYAVGDMAFTSTTAGRIYYGYFSDSFRTGVDTVLIGLAYRPFAPSALRRHVVEAGAAVGPAFVRAGPSSEQAESMPTVRKVAFCGRVRAGYDFYFVPAFSVGAFAGYRYLETELSGLASSRRLTFSNGDIIPEPDSFERLTETNLPPVPIKKTGFFWGLRTGFRF